MTLQGDPATSLRSRSGKVQGPGGPVLPPTTCEEFEGSVGTDPPAVVPSKPEAVRTLGRRTGADRRRPPSSRRAGLSLLVPGLRGTLFGAEGTGDPGSTNRGTRGRVDPLKDGVCEFLRLKRNRRSGDQGDFPSSLLRGSRTTGP